MQISYLLYPNTFMVYLILRTWKWDIETSINSPPNINYVNSQASGHLHRISVVYVSQS